MKVVPLSPCVPDYGQQGPRDTAARILQPSAPAKGSGLSSVDGNKSQTPSPRGADGSLGAHGRATPSLLTEGTVWGPVVTVFLAPEESRVLLNLGCAVLENREGSFFSSPPPPNLASCRILFQDGETCH